MNDKAQALKIAFNDFVDALSDYCNEFNAERPTATVHYDLNGATGSVPDDQTGEVGTALILGIPNIKERFKCWNTLPGGNDLDFEGGKKVYLYGTLGSDVTLYAIWE